MLITGKGKELEFPEGRGGGKGQQRSPGVPPILVHSVSISVSISKSMTSVS
jgi:hypothetical protein